MPNDRKQNDLTGILFRNDEKDANHDKWPDYKGTATINGVEYWLNAWIKPTKTGGKFMSLSFKPKSETRAKPQTAAPPSQAPQPDSQPELPAGEDEVPF